MELKRNSLLVYGLVAAAWILVLAWQIADHNRVQQLAREALIHRAKDFSTEAGTTLRLLRRYGRVLISKEQAESVFKELLRPGEWEGISLFNEAGDVVASAALAGPLPKGETELWKGETVTLLNPVALGTNVTSDLEVTNPPVIPVIIPREEFPRPDTNRPPPMFPGGIGAGETNMPGRPPPPPEREPFPGRDQEGATIAPASSSPMLTSTNPGPPAFRPRGGGPGRFRGFTRPPGWSDEEWKTIMEQHGVHSFAIVMSTKTFKKDMSRDLWLRSIIMVLATVSVVGSGLAWRNVTKSSDLQIRLIRASEMNSHLKEMNLAAAGLAHETRNPLNIIRGLAQMIFKQPELSPEIRQKSREIIDETDHVTAQLNEFINYSRPREVHRSALALNTVVTEVVRTLNYDIEEKNIRLQVNGEPLTIQADEQLLRQALFNLLLNAVQAVDKNGKVEIFIQKRNPSEAFLEIRDNGPGVTAEQRAQIFKPYFTTQPKGTGLGLAVVQQIVLAHGWEIECVPNEPKGATFRITHLRLAG
jgi:signal transduction histidine kinase